MIVLDTHVLIWAVDNNPRLGAETRETLQQASASGAVHVSAITPWEIAMLVQKGGLALSREIGSWIGAALQLPGMRLAPLTPAIAIDSVALPGEFHADPADRLIIATARASGFLLLTSDTAILRYGSAGHVRVAPAHV